MTDLIFWNSASGSTGPTRAVGPHQLASWLTKHGYRVKVIDFCDSMTTDQLVDVTLHYLSPTTVGIGVSSTFWKNPPLVPKDCNRIETLQSGEPDWVIRAREKLKTKSVKWLLGGVNSVGTFTYDWIKFHGHAEDTLLRFMDESCKSLKVRTQFDIKNLENSFYDDLHIQSTETLPIELSRGCQFKCRFCRYPLLGKKKNTYIRDYSFVEKEFLENYQRYGITNYFFLDDTVNESDEKIEALAEIADRLPFKLNWFGYNRLDLIGSKPHTIQLLKQSGLRSSFFGIESFHPDASKIVGKGWNGKHGKDFVLQLKEIWGESISFHLGFISGITGETISDLYDTQEWCIKNNIPSWRFSGLSINKKEDQLVRSEFDINYSMYGYRFPDPNIPEFWENDNWNSITAQEVAQQLAYDANPYMKVTGFSLGELLSLGYNIDDLVNRYRSAIDWNDVKDRTDTFLKNYVKAMLNT